MTDYFALLNEPRRPWLDPEALKDKFLAMSAQSHPDRVHNLGRLEQEAAHARYLDLNAAYHCLREPKDRLRHLLELERGTIPTEVQQVPSDLMDLFVEVGQACREADAHLTAKAATSSPLLRVRLFERGQEWMEKLEALRQRIEVKQATVIGELKSLDGAWQKAGGPSERGALLDQLERLHRLSSFYSRWSSQLQERLLQLSW